MQPLRLEGCALSPRQKGMLTSHDMRSYSRPMSGVREQRNSRCSTSQPVTHSVTQSVSQSLGLLACLPIWASRCQQPMLACTVHYMPIGCDSLCVNRTFVPIVGPPSGQRVSDMGPHQSALPLVNFTPRGSQMPHTSRRSVCKPPTIVRQIGCEF